MRQTVEEIEGKVRIVEATKSSASRRTLAVPEAIINELSVHVAAFRGHADPGDLLFIGPRGGVLRRHFLPRYLKPAAASLGIEVRRREGLDFHGLRHVATSLMVSTGEHPKVMQSRLGHATPNLTLGLYAHVPDESDRAAAQRLDALIKGEDSGH